MHSCFVLGPQRRSPEQVASFDFTHHPDTGAWTLSVSPISPPSSQPFFKVTVHPIPLLSRLSIPVNSASLGKYLLLVQPPLPKGDVEEEVASGVDEDDGGNGAAKWCSLVPGMKGRLRLVRVQAELQTDGSGDSSKKVIADGKQFPNVAPLWGIGMQMDDLTLEFGLPEWKQSFDEVR